MFFYFGLFLNELLAVLDYDTLVARINLNTHDIVHRCLDIEALLYKRLNHAIKWVVVGIFVPHTFIRSVAGIVLVEVTRIAELLKELSDIGLAVFAYESERTGVVSKNITSLVLLFVIAVELEAYLASVAMMKLLELLASGTIRQLSRSMLPREVLYTPDIARSLAV